MSRHCGVLPDEYKQKLKGMTLHEIAAEAAKFRSDGKRCGTATALILRWTIINRLAPDAKDYFLALYNKAWMVEKDARRHEQSARPQNRPVRGGRRYPMRDSRDRHGFVAYC